MKITIKSKIWFEKDNKNVFGKGKYLILKAIDETGSLNKAAKRVNISYRRAWSYITGAEKRLGKALITKVKGGKHGGGAILTEYAKDLIGKFNVIEEKVGVFTEKIFKDTFYKGSEEKT